MSNYYQIVTAEETVPCTPQDFEVFKRRLSMPNPNDEEASLSDPPSHGFSVEYEAAGRALFLYAEENGTFSSIPAPALAFLAELLRKAGRPFLEFGYACVCDRSRPGSHGGGSFRFYADGSIVDPIIQWPETE